MRWRRSSEQPGWRAPSPSSAIRSAAASPSSLPCGTRERVGALVLVGSVGVAGALSGFDRLLTVPMVGDGILRAGVAATRRALIAATRYSERHPGTRLAPKVGRRAHRPAAGIGDGSRPLVGRGRQSFLVEQRALVAETPGLERALCRIAVPTAVVNGASDRIVPSSAARSLAERIPGAELVVVAGGHLLPFDHPDLVARGRTPLLGAGVRGSGSDSGSQERLKLELGLGQLLVRVGVRDDPDAGEEPGRASLDDRRADAETPLPVGACIDPAHGAGVAVPVEVLELREVVEGQVHRCAGNCWSRMEQADELEGAREGSLPPGERAR